jgi:hypothetical protein
VDPSAGIVASMWGGPLSISLRPERGLRALLQSRAELLDVVVPVHEHREQIRLPLIVCALAALWFTLAATVAPYVADDAFILFRHVQHLLAGQGAIWDPAYPVEAHSSPLWVLLLAGGSTLGASLPDTSVWLGILCSASAMALLMIVTRDLGKPWIRFALVAIVATNPPVTTWTNAGLEMPLALFAVLSFVCATASLWRQSNVGAYAGLVVCCFLSSSIRPDLPLQFVACIVVLSFLRGAPRRALLAGAIAIGTGAILLALWR